MENSMSLLSFIGLIVIGGLLFAGFITALTISEQYSLYLGYQEKGYMVKFEGITCYIAMKNIDDSSEWKVCSNLGDNFVLENYGVKVK